MYLSEIDFVITFDFNGNINLIILEDELLIILTTEISHAAKIKGQFVYKDLWIPRLGDIYLIVNQKTRR